MIAALLTFIITVLIFACAYLAYQLSNANKLEMSQRKQVQELTAYIRLARWVVRNIHKDDLDQLIQDHTPPTFKEV